MDREINVIIGDPTSEETLEKANINQARALVVDLPKQESASIILSGRRMEPDVPILSVTEDEQTEKYHRYAGADHTIRPRQALGRRLADETVHSVGRAVTGAIELSDNFEVTELLVEPRSDLAGQSLEKAQIRQQFGVNLIGMWTDGEFAARLNPSTVITGGTILLAAHRGIESVTLDRGAAHLKDELMPRYAELIYNGYWFSPEREMLQALIDRSQEPVNGTVKVRLYEGMAQVVGGSWAD
jgi:Trk K+ transport system NAD-binding subunit